MWSINFEDIQRAKEELKGRRAAIEARYASELKALDTDTSELDTLERVAASFAQKHSPEEEALPSQPAEEPPETVLETAGDMAPALGDAAMAGGEPRSTSRWRLRLGDAQNERD